MNKRAMHLLLALMAVPSFATAATYWQITATTSPTALKTNLTAARPANFGNYTTPGGAAMSLTKVTRTPYNTVSFDVKAVPDKSVIVKVDGVQVGTAPGTYNVGKGTLLSHNIVAYYSTAAAQYTLNTQVAAGGVISSTATYSANGAVSVTPFPGYTLSGLKIGSTTYLFADALPAGITMSGDSSGAIYTFASGTYTVQGVFAAAPAAKATISTPSQTVATGTIGIAIDGSTSIGTNFAWTASCGTVTPIAPNSTAATYNAVATVGECTVTLTASASGVTPDKTATVKFTTFSKFEQSVNSCLACHNGTDGPAAPGYGTSLHYTNLFHKVSCSDCHNASSASSHPFDSFVTVKNVCITCHAGPYVAHGGLYSTCTGCHNPHSAAVNTGIIDTLTKGPHKGGAPFHKAQYVSDASLPVSCASCHGEPVDVSANQAILRQYTSSSHGKTTAEAWLHFDWRSGSRSACARCHNGTAFVAKLGSENNTTNVFTNSDALKPGEVLNCSACHTDTATGAIRSADAQFTINMRNGATATYNVVGASTLCARCHSGRETGASITADPSTTGVAVFVDSHYLPVAGTLYNIGGYEYSGQTYALGSHKTLGATGPGPCVTCHMSGKNHTFAAASCASCHDGTPAVVDAATLKANYDTALNNLKLALAAKGIHYGPVHPFFFTAAYVAGSPNTAYTNWAAPYDATRWKDTMGAAYNYNMLWSEKGAYAHNYGYAMKLIADSTNFINNGSL